MQGMLYRDVQLFEGEIAKVDLDPRRCSKSRWSTSESGQSSDDLESEDQLSGLAAATSDESNPAFESFGHDIVPWSKSSDSMSGAMFQRLQ